MKTLNFFWIPKSCREAGAKSRILGFLEWPRMGAKAEMVFTHLGEGVFEIGFLCHNGRSMFYNAVFSVLEETEIMFDFRLVGPGVFAFEAIVPDDSGGRELKFKIKEIGKSELFALMPPQESAYNYAKAKIGTVLIGNNGLNVKIPKA